MNTIIIAVIIIFSALSILGIGGIVLILLYPEITEKTCPKCRKFWTGELLQDEVSGIFRKTVRLFPAKKLGFQKHGMIFYEKHILRYKCKSCGHEWHQAKLKER